MKKKIILTGITLLLSILLTSYKLMIKENKIPKQISQKNIIENPFEILGENNLAFTLNGNTTILTYEELITTKLINSITCEKGTKATWNSTTNAISLTEIKIPDYCTVDFKDKPNYLYSQILKDHPSRGTERPNSFSGVYTEDNTKTLYETTKTENGNKSYYFAGNSLDNWVYFAGFYWRIIRINEDNSVRLLYVGPDKNTTSGYISTSTYNSTENHPRYVGYMYGQNSTDLASDRKNNINSTIKGVIDSWYGTNITNKNDGNNSYDKYVSRTAIYCNDRSISSGSYSISETFSFGSTGRLLDSKSPSYKCGANTSNGLYESSQAVADKFSGSATGGNGLLSEAPVALMTADEVSFAGGGSGTNAPTWYYYNAVGESVVSENFWWTISPCSIGSTGKSRVFYIGGSSNPGNFSVQDVGISYGVRPVVSLKSCVGYESGDGTSNNPYKVTINPTCINELN